MPELESYGDTVRENLPEEFQTAEYVKDHGGYRFS